MHKIINGDCLEVMRSMDGNSIDFVVCDPPYGLKFMGKSWDHGIPGVDYWQEALRVCKPGSMLAAFGGTRTYHRLTCAIEDAGWEIRDCISYLYGSGFPKSYNKFGIDGYGTALKPAWEPIIIAMKPLEGTYKQNVEKWGLGGINIDGCRIASELLDGRTNNGGGTSMFKGLNLEYKHTLPSGRWPANLILDEEAAQLLDEQSGISKSPPIGSMCAGSKSGDIYKKGFIGKISQNGFGDSGGASRFFYCAKASKSERNAGLENKLNAHPTVKPLSLMRYIITLLAPPGTPTLLDPFAGSGSTLCAAKQLGINALGIELDEDYCEIAEKRVSHYLGG
jgi:site-specific DNA-methyltransferase (adenine-specific)